MEYWLGSRLTPVLVTAPFVNGRSVVLMFGSLCEPWSKILFGSTPQRVHLLAFLRKEKKKF